MQTVLRFVSTKTEAKKSTFLCFLCSICEFKALHEHLKAAHVVWALRERNGYGQIVENQSDDGEPKGTSRQPSLNALNGLSKAWNSAKEFFGFSDDETDSRTQAKTTSLDWTSSGYTPSNPVSPQAAAVAATASGANINISFNGDFLLNSNNGKFDLESFKAQITRGVKEALRRDEFNSANTEIREQR